MSITKDRIAITIDQDLVEELDKLKGICPRSTYINHILRVFLKIKNENGVLRELDRLLQK